MTEQSPAEVIFFAALEKTTAEERAAYLDAACGDDSNLRRRVERLLAAHPQVGSFLEPPAQEKVNPASSPAGEKAPTNLDLADTSSYAGSSERVGSVIASKYKLLQTLGEGGMGAVFMAQQTAPVKRLVALKLIKLGMDSKQVLARFEAERQALALMDHPNIAKVLDAGATDSGRPFFVMELVKGVPITRFSDERQLSPRERLELFIPVCQAIQHAHQKGIIHRDIKPTNVLVALYDDRPVPKVIDFGVAKAAGSQLTDASLATGFGAVVGTPEYMSPEQAQLNQLDIDTRSDVYGLGVLLYELLTGTTPIDRKRLGQQALLEILRVIREEEPPRPSARLSTSEALASIAATRRTEPAKLAKLIRGELDWIVMKCLEKDRSRRYETANGLARDVERYLHDEVVEAQPPSAGYRLRKFMRKHRTALTTAASILLLLLASVAVISWALVQATWAGRQKAQALTVAEEQRRTADELRKKAEAQAASLAVDSDLKYFEEGEVTVGLLRLANTLRNIPEHARELRECVALNILAWGQKFRPAWAPNHDGYDLIEAKLSPDGLSVATSGEDGTVRLWDSLTGKQRAILGEPLLAGPKILQFSTDGKTVLTQIDDRPSSGPRRGYSKSRHEVVRLWDAATGDLRWSTGEHRANAMDFRLSKDGSLLVTCSFLSNRPGLGEWTVQFWNASSGQRIGKAVFQGSVSMAFDVSPDGKHVLIAHDGFVDAFVAHDGSRPTRLPGKDIADSHYPEVAFSPSGRSAITISNNAVCWWDTTDWQLHRRVPFPQGTQGTRWALWFMRDDILAMPLRDSGNDRLFLVRELSQPLYASINRLDCYQGRNIRVSPNGLRLVIGSHVYDALSGQQLPTPSAHTYHPDLSQLAADGRFALLDQFIVDVVADKEVGLFHESGMFSDAERDGRFLADPETWVAVVNRQMVVLRKSDASLDADLLRRWCEVITRGKLDESRRFSKFDEATWEKSRVDLLALLDANPKAQSLRSAVTDALYWLREEIKNSSAPLALLDRLVAAEPTWPSYSRRAKAHADISHWVQALRDDLEAAGLTSECYWIQGSQRDWEVGLNIVDAPGRPQEEYELALRWTETRCRAGVTGNVLDPVGPGRLSMRSLTMALALFRVGRYADALTTLRTDDYPFLAEATGMLMSPWSMLHLIVVPHYFGGSPGEWTIQRFGFHSVDLIARAMCHYHLGQPKEAKGCLQQARKQMGTGVWPASYVALLREAELLIEGNGGAKLRN
jgi:serine/threonine protein kinase